MLRHSYDNSTCFILCCKPRHSCHPQKWSLSKILSRYYTALLLPHYFLPPTRDQSVISRLRTSAKFPRVYTNTKRYCSFLNFALNNYQDKIQTQQQSTCTILIPTLTLMTFHISHCDCISLNSWFLFIVFLLFMYSLHVVFFSIDCICIHTFSLMAASMLIKFSVCQCVSESLISGHAGY